MVCMLGYQLQARMTAGNSKVAAGVLKGTYFDVVLRCHHQVIVSCVLPGIEGTVYVAGDPDWPAEGESEGGGTGREGPQTARENHR